MVNQNNLLFFQGYVLCGLHTAVYYQYSVSINLPKLSIYIYSAAYDNIHYLWHIVAYRNVLLCFRFKSKPHDLSLDHNGDYGYYLQDNEIFFIKDSAVSDSKSQFN